LFKIAFFDFAVLPLFLLKNQVWCCIEYLRMHLIEGYTVIAGVTQAPKVSRVWNPRASQQKGQVFKKVKNTVEVDEVWPWFLSFPPFILYFILSHSLMQSSPCQNLAPPVQINVDSLQSSLPLPFLSERQNATTPSHHL
jgi:hypothetical protein